MDKQQARNIVRDTLGKPFAKEAFTRLAKELFNQIDESKAFHARGYVPESYKKYVKTYERLATLLTGGAMEKIKALQRSRHG